MKRILRLSSLRPKEAETRRTETGVKAYSGVGRGEGQHGWRRWRGGGRWRESGDGP